MVKPMNELDIIQNYFSCQSVPLDGPKSISCGEIQFDYFIHTNDDNPKTILYIAYKPEVQAVERAIEELPGSLERIVIKTTDAVYQACLSERGWSVVLLDTMKKELEANEMADKQQSNAESSESDEVLKEAISLLNRLRTAIENSSKDFTRTTPLCTYQVNGKTVSFDLRDILLVGAVAQADILLTGKTGSGKTKLANAVMRGLFGDAGFYSKTILPTMTPNDFMDIDFEKIKKGGNLSEAIKGIPALENAGVVLNEVNRAPGVIQNMLIAFLDKEFEVQGKPVPMGRIYDENKRYQLRILTINEGGMYRVENLDPAIRDRMTIEVPVDAFPQSREDVLEMLDSETSPFNSAEDLFETVIQLHQLLGQVLVSEGCKRFLAYLAGMSYCIRAPRGNKESFTLSAETCAGCPHIGLFGQVCPSVRAPSARILLQLQKIARAFALFRSWKTGGSPLVVYQDVVEAAPFVLYSKLNLDEHWVRTNANANGDRWTAIKKLIEWVYKDRFLPTQDSKNPIYAFLTAKQEGSEVKLEILNVVQKYIMTTDPWCYNLPSVILEIEKHLSAKT